MKRSLVIAFGSAALGAVLVAGGVWAQGPQPMPPGGQMPHGQMPHGQMPQGAMPYGMHQQHHPAGGGQSISGQGAFGAMAEVVRVLEADPATD